jgi:Secretion system C-terminal sorting domain
MNSAIVNNEPLTTLNSTYKTGATDGVLTYQSCLTGYPFTSADPNWRKASMERRNSPTEINYYPEVNDNLPFATSDMKGLQIREPLQNGTAVNTMVYAFSTAGYKDIQFTFAAINELTNATGILVDYSTTAGAPSWQTAGLASATLALTNGYQSFTVDFAGIPSANNNPDFKLRLRFAGSNLTADAGNRVTFNNVTVNGALLPLAVDSNDYTKFSIFPNPVNQELYITGASPAELVRYHIFAVDGKLMQKGEVANGQILCDQLAKGLYFLQLEVNGKTETKKIIKD